MTAPSRARRRPSGLSLVYWLLLVLLYVPIAILFVFSLNDGTTLSFPLKGFTLDWYGKILTTSGLLDSVQHSLIVAAVSSTAATILGTMIAVLISRFEFRGKGLLTGLAILPLIVPYVVLGVAFLILFKAFNVELSIVTVSVGHAIVALPYASLIVLVRLVGAEPQLEDAALDLGATYPGALRLVVLPMAAPAIVSVQLLLKYPGGEETTSWSHGAVVDPSGLVMMSGSEIGVPFRKAKGWAARRISCPGKKERTLRKLSTCSPPRNRLWTKTTRAMSRHSIAMPSTRIAISAAAT